MYVSVGQAFGDGLDGLAASVQHEFAQVAVTPGPRVFAGQGREDLGAERVEILAEFLYCSQVHQLIMTESHHVIRNLTKYY